MSTDATEYPITQLLLEIIDESGLSQPEFVQRLGYPFDVERGMRRLRLWLDAGQGHDRIIKEIIAVYPYRRDAVQDALSRTKVIKAAEAEAARKHATRHIEERLRRRFKPFIWISTEETAHSFYAAMFERKTKVLWFDEGFELLPESEQLATAQIRVREHHAANAGQSAFGKILGYRFVLTFDASVTLRVNGEVIDSNAARLQLSEVWLELTPNRKGSSLCDRLIEPTPSITYACRDDVLRYLCIALPIGNGRIAI